MIIDIHTHAFPDRLAGRAVPYLEEEGGIHAHLDGRVSSLVDSMDGAGVDVSVVASIATKPEQFDSILSWSESIAGSRIIPFPSVHPSDPRVVERVTEVRRRGFSGLKLHPYYQEFALDEKRMTPLFERIEEEGLILLLHTGFDLAFERYRIADPKRIDVLIQRHPGLRLITSHLGAWEDWDQVEKYLLGRNVYMDTSYAFRFIGSDRARRFLLAHPEDYILFGTDSPWGNQRSDREEIEHLDLPESLKRKILGGNAAALLALQ